MTATILRGDARRLPLADASVDLIVTSPPYWALRDYRDGGESLAGQIGAEPTPGEYIDSLIECTREWMRVLKPSGSCFVNLGDKFVDKSLLGLPWQYALRCKSQLGLILRAEVIWDKPSGLPESVTDRVRRSHEQWFHLVKHPQYFSAVDEIREPHAPASLARYAQGDPISGVRARRASVSVSGGVNALTAANPLGKMPSSVWTIATQPLKVPAHLGVDHFAAFPTEWPRRIISGWSPSGICTACGEGRRPVASRQAIPSVTSSQAAVDRVTATGGAITGGTARSTLRGTTIHAITGYACACPEPTAPTRPSVVLDPFGGTGTTALVASVLGRHGISVDMSADYCRLAAWRTTDPGERARVIGAQKPAPEAPGQLALFDLEAS